MFLLFFFLIIFLAYCIVLHLSTNFTCTTERNAGHCNAHNELYNGSALTTPGRDVQCVIALRLTSDIHVLGRPLGVGPNEIHVWCSHRKARLLVAGRFSVSAQLVEGHRKGTAYLKEVHKVASRLTISRCRQPIYRL